MQKLIVNGGMKMARTLILKSIRLKNFKGVKEFMTKVNLVTDIKGTNASGKTTIADAVSWILFGKDSMGNAPGKTFVIQPLDENGDTIHNLETEVNAIFSLDGVEKNLRKVLVEKWTKPNGSEEKKLAGTTVKYYIDEVPKKEKEYKEEIASIIDENIFKLLTNPYAFEAMKWQDKRKILFEVCGGDIKEDDVYNADNGLEALKQAIGDKTLEDWKKIQAERKKRLKDDFEKIAPKIDALTEATKDVDVDELNTQLESKNNELEKASAILKANMEVYDEIKGKQRKVLEIKTRIDTKMKEVALATNKDIDIKRIELKEVETDLENVVLKLNKCVKRINSLNDELKSNTEENEKLTSDIDTLRDEYNAKGSEEFVFDESQKVCKCCGQLLPIGKMNELREHLHEAWLNDRDRELEMILLKVKPKKERIKQLELENEDVKTRIESGNEEINKTKKDQAELEEKKTEIVEYLNTHSEIEPTEDEEIRALKKELQLLEKEIAEYEEPDTSDIEMKIRLIREDIREITDKLAQEKVYEANRIKIKEYTEQKEALGREIAECEKMDVLAEHFYTTKCELIEEKINNTFNGVKFKLFNRQVNGGITETCEALVNGVPFSGANPGYQVPVGLEIIKALNEYYGLYVPIFVDNREGVVNIPEMTSQIINLYVDATKDEITVE